MNVASDEEPRFVEDSVVLVLDDQRQVRWRSGDLAGYGLQGLDVDALGHIYGLYAVTNHSTKAFVLAVDDEGVEDFGTIGGSLKIDGYTSSPRLGTGARDLYTFREGWPANTQRLTTSMDVWSWDGSDYTYRGCAAGGPQDLHRLIQEASLEHCSSPIGRYSIELPGDRSADEEPP